MSLDDEMVLDTSDMVSLHRCLDRALGDAPAQIAAVHDDDTAGARRVADYLSEVCWLLHAHHVGEDELLYPLLAERAPEHQALFSEMDEQHVAVATDLEAVERVVERFGQSGSVIDGATLAAECEALRSTMAEHLIDEEEQVLPIAARFISAPEWAALPIHALSSYQGERIWLPFGLALEAMPDEMRENLLAHLPPPVSAMWLGGGRDAFTNEMTAIRGNAS